MKWFERVRLPCFLGPPGLAPAGGTAQKVTKMSRETLLYKRFVGSGKMQHLIEFQNARNVTI